MVGLKTKSAGDDYPKKAIEKKVLRFLGSRTFSHDLGRLETAGRRRANGRNRRKRVNRHGGEDRQLPSPRSAKFHRTTSATAARATVASRSLLDLSGRLFSVNGGILRSSRNLAPGVYEMRWVGRRLPRYEDRSLLQGRGRYTADLAQGARRLRFVRSPVARGRILTVKAPRKCRS